jgi:tetratricopeptide (TPR) repeat protein
MHYRIDQNTLREKIIDKTLYNDELKLYLRSISIKDSDYAHYCSRLGDLYRINGELTLAKLYLKNAEEALKYQPNEPLSFLTELRLAIVYQWEQDYEESEKLFDSLEAKAKGTIEGFVYQHRALMEYERNNLWLALNYFEKARRLRPEDKELLSYIDMGIHRVKMLLKLK